MTRKIAKPMTAQARAVLRAAILHALNESGPTTIAALEVVTGLSEKRVYRELLTLQETRDVIRRGVGRATRYGVKTTRWVDAAITHHNAPKKPPPTESWWVNKSRDELMRLSHTKTDWSTVTSLRKGEGAR